MRISLKSSFSLILFLTLCGLHSVESLVHNTTTNITTGPLNSACPSDDDPVKEEPFSFVQNVCRGQNFWSDPSKQTSPLQRWPSFAELFEAFYNEESPRDVKTTEIFTWLEAYPDMDKVADLKPRYKKTHLGLRNDDTYCLKADRYNIDDPLNMFTTMKFFTDYPKRGLPRNIMKNMGKVMMPFIFTPLPEEVFYSRKFNLSRVITHFFTNFKGSMDQHHQVGAHFLCATQMYNHIPGHGALIRKDSILDSLDVYSQKYADRPQCFHKHLYFPKFFRLYNKTECKRFFAMVNSEKYNQSLIQEPIQYLIKIGRGSHKGQGVFLLDESRVGELNTDYQFGKKCGSNKKSLLAQAYITNPLLLDMNNKFDFRLYVLIASTNPLIIYYHDGFLRVALSPFTKSSSDKATHLTNTFLANQKIAEALERGERLNEMEEDELEEYHLWSFEKLEQFLLETGRVKDPNWLNNYLRPAFHKSINHIVRMTRGGFLNSSNVYELLGFDFILDNNMDLWFIESNPSPLLTGTKKHYVYFETVHDMFDIMFAYYKSRMKRVLEVVKKITAKFGEEEEEQQKPDEESLAMYREEYREAVVNRLDPEFPIRANNTWKLIADENLPKAEAYFGLISEECL